ncbi:MAG: DUF3828 domain-containing protein [Pseudomonadota bacterium]
MRLWVLASAILALMLGGCTTASAQEGSEGAKEFVEGVYASYQDDQPWPIDDTRLDAVWSPRMAALIRRDRELADGELPYLDADPICNCQDFENLTVRHVQIYQDRTGRYGSRMARVEFTNAGEEVTIVLSLAGNPIQGWRIDDVVNQDGYPSLAENLAASNAGIEAGGRAGGRE